MIYNIYNHGLTYLVNFGGLTYNHSKYKRPIEHEKD